MVDKIIITDTHFGVKNNSSKFLENQFRIFEDLFKMIEINPNDRMDLIHLGDLFDSRSTISIYVFNKVKNLFVNLYKELQDRNPDNTIIFLAGNHDFFSQNSQEINSLDALMSSALPNCKFITKKSCIIDRCLYVPWYDANNVEVFKEVSETNKDKYDTIFTHTELFGVYRDLDFLKTLNKLVISGHIHKSAKYIFDESKLYNICTPYSINFGDAGDEFKGIWKLVDQELTLFKNTKSLMFWSIYNEDIFEIPESNIKRGDNYNIYINKCNLSDEKYITTLKELSTKIQYINIIPVSDELIYESTKADIDIDNIIYKLIGEERKEYFDKIKQDLAEYESQ